MEDKEFEDWYNAADENMHIPLLADERRKHHAADKAWRKLHRRLFASHRMLIWRYAAACCLLLCGIYGYYSWRNDAAKVEHHTLYYETALGQQKELLLPDGSRLYLFEGSRLQLDSANFTTNRQLLLEEGEFFVDVKRDSLHPFEVHSKQTVVKVLGTSFSVRNYQTEDQFELAVKTGRVEVLSADHTKRSVLGAGERLRYTTSDGRWELSQQNIATIGSKVHGKLVFQEERLARILQDLSRKYAVEVFSNDELLLADRYSITFGQATLEECLQKLTTIGEMHIRKVNETLIEIYK